MSEQEATMEAAASLPGECFRFECLILSLLALSLLTIVECQKSKNFDKVPYISCDSSKNIINLCFDFYVEVEVKVEANVVQLTIMFQSAKSKLASYISPSPKDNKRKSPLNSSFYGV